MVVELVFAKGEAGGPLSVGDLLVAAAIAFIYVAIVVVVVTSERRSVKAQEHQHGRPSVRRI